MSGLKAAYTVFAIANIGVIWGVCMAQRQRGNLPRVFMSVAVLGTIACGACVVAVWI